MYGRYMAFAATEDVFNFLLKGIRPACRQAGELLFCSAL